MSKAFRRWKEAREWGILHRYPTPKRLFTLRNYRRWKRYLGRDRRGIVKSARDCSSQIMPDEWKRYVREGV